MSILIKGMDIPYGCANCNFVGSPIYDSKGRAIYSCNVPVDSISGKNVTEQVIDMYEGGGGNCFPNWCPLVALPEKHGRLIDADAFADRIKFLIELQGYDDLSIDRYLTVGEVLNAVIDDLRGTALNGYENTPTVIEEEDEDDNRRL